MNQSYLETKNKTACFGCEACVSVCKNAAIEMIADEEGFRYPNIDAAKCINCGACSRVCPIKNELNAHDPIEAFGGYVIKTDVRTDSTSGGFFSAIVESWADDKTIIFGAESIGLDVRHSWVEGKKNISKFRKSKYLQSIVGNSYSDVSRFLLEDRRVIFSGTPCQIAGLKSFLGKRGDSEKLLTIEVVCEGVPSPYYIKKFAAYLENKIGGSVVSLDYRAKSTKSGKWDFQMMEAELKDDNEASYIWRQDRWFNPFWSIWLQHLMSRPSCYECKFATRSRVADITLGDLWGVHLYCPELYGKNHGCSVAFCNTEKGKLALSAAKPLIYGHELSIETAIKYQGPLRNHIATNPGRDEFMQDLKVMSYHDLVKKWSKSPTLKLLSISRNISSIISLVILLTFSFSMFTSILM
jgi:coenzyme F420-reducing hydrogenase beta subunit